MSKQTKKKMSREKRVLIGALGVAAVMIGGSTFAWFSSQDEVTNRLSASANYGVAITETFLPPEEWTPGQTINKDVAIVNTGNIDALVKVELAGALALKVEGDGVAVSAFYPADTDTLATLEKLTGNERIALQAGGYLASAPDGVTTGAVESASFTPDTAKPGLYLFRRQITSGTTPTYDYSGYYFDGTDYYGLKTIEETDGSNTVRTSDVFQNKGDTLTSADIAAVKLRNYTDKAVAANSTELDWDYSKATTDKVVKLTYHPGGATNTSTAKDIIININLADNMGDGTVADKWQYIDGKGFFYTNDVEAGEETTALVDSVTLDPAVQAGAYQNMDFDLTVKLNSVQVVLDDDQNETTAADDELGATATATMDTTDTHEIAVIKWTAATT